MKKLVYYFLLLIFILTHGCKPDDISPKSNTDPSEQIGRTTSALLGEVTFEDDCSPEHQAFNDSIMMFARIAVATDAFEECLREKVTDLYQKCNGDPFYNENVNVQIEKVLEVARSLNNVHITCTGGSGNASAIIDNYGKLSDEFFSWGGWFSTVYSQLEKPVCSTGQSPGANNCRFAAYPWPYSQAAGIVLHEIMHQHGYTHGADDQTNALINCGYSGDPNWHFQVNTMPYIVESCIVDVINQSAINCDLNQCSGSRQLSLVRHYNQADCDCKGDPKSEGIGIIRYDDKLIDETIKPYTDWVGGWNLGEKDVVKFKGDFKGDGNEDLVFLSGWGVGILSYNGQIWEPLVVKPNGTSFGGWNFQSHDNKIHAVDDFNGDGKDEILISSGWGIAILSLQGNTLVPLMIKPNDTWFGQWRYNSKDNQIQGVGNFSGNNQAGILITSGWGIAILELSGNTLISKVAKENGTSFGGWNFQSKDNKFHGIGDFRNDGKDDIVISSDWGIAILSLQGNSLTSIMIKPNDTWFGQWRYNSKDNQIQGIGKYSGNGKAGILITSGWGIGVLELSGNTLISVIAKPNGTSFDGWYFQVSDNKFHGVGKFNNDNKDDIIISSGWGIAILTVNGNNFTNLDMRPVGSLIGSWLLESSDNILVIANTGEGSNDKIIIKKSL